MFLIIFLLFILFLKKNKLRHNSIDPLFHFSSVWFRVNLRGDSLVLGHIVWWVRGFYVCVCGGGGLAEFWSFFIPRIESTS